MSQVGKGDVIVTNLPGLITPDTAVNPVRVSMSGSSQQVFISSTPLVNGLILKSSPTNTGQIWFKIDGTPYPTAIPPFKGMRMDPGDIITVNMADGSDLFVIGTVAGDELTIVGG